MAAYVLRRLLYGVPILLGITLITFVLFHVVGGDPAIVRAGKHASPERLAEIRRELGTDRPLYFKAYGSYRLPIGLTVGLTAGAYSGVPTSVEVTLGGMQGVYPVGRATEGRSPFIFTSSVFVEYTLHMGRTNLAISLNVDNVTNNGAARRVYGLYNQDDPALTQGEILAHYDYRSVVEDLDPRFNKEYFFLSPISARLGIRFGF